MEQNILLVNDLRVHFFTRRGTYKALNGVELIIKKGEIFGLAGESGCGKTTLGLSIMGLLPRNAAIITGKVLLDNFDLIAPLRDFAQKNINNFNFRRNENIIKKLNDKLVNIRGKKISMVFQDSMTSLNPVLQIGYQIAESFIVHQPNQLLKRKLARVNAKQNQLEEILDMLKNGASEDEVVAFAESNGLSGIEEQVINVWRRNDMSEANKEKIIMSLHSEKLGFFEKIFVFSNKNKAQSLARVPGFSRMYKNTLIKEGYRKAVELLSMLEIPNPDRVVKMYPHELSGGMRQRIMIAIALANNPELVIMDEPTSALDVTVQAQILELIKSLKGRFNTSFIIISHDLSVLAEVCDRIGIMYGGRIVEISSKEDVFKKPLHPYTQMLISAIPTIESQDLRGIGGSVPDMRNPPNGCMFHPRCPYVMDICKTKEPKMLEKDGHLVSCFLYGEDS